MRITGSVNRTLTLGLVCASMAIVSGCANDKPKAGSDGASGVSNGTATKSPIVVGEFGSLSGSESTFGTSTDNGLKLACNEINAKGGIDGHPLNVHVLDDEGKPDSALTVVQKLINQDKPIAIIGEVASKLSIQAAPACNSNKVPMISPSSTNPKVTQIGPYIFRVCFIDPFQGTAAAKFAVGTLKAKRAAIMTDQQNDYSTGLTKFFTASFTQQGGTIVANPSYTKDDLDFHSQLANIKALNPDVIYVPGYYGQIGPIAKQARQLGITAPLLGGDGWDSPKLVEGAGGPGKALEGCYFTNHSSMENPDPAIQNFVKAFKTANNNAQPDALAALGYDAGMVLADAIKRTGAPADGDYSAEAYRVKLRDSIAATKDFPGATGAITIGPDRNAVKPAVVLQVKGADFKYVTTVNP
ncbi:MAG: ABC transporter substrate-binding protein [Capsulimonas sp.]|uniref:ABC transporter substrate-binding protein n=1 Tax=Capsulimonas sp. TaxID=2494211 RepID=UPI0032671C9B